jgi:hypothetical protein
MVRWLSASIPRRNVFANCFGRFDLDQIFRCHVLGGSQPIATGAADTE